MYSCWIFNKNIEILFIDIFYKHHSKSTSGSCESHFTLYFISKIIMEQKQGTNCDNLLLDNISTLLPIDTTLSTTPKQLCNSIPSLLKNHQSEVLDKENSPINNSHITKMEDYINKKYDQIALEHLKSQIVKEIKHEFTNNDTNDLNNKGSQKDASDVITELRVHIQTLESEVYFLREEIKVKSFLLRSLITDKHNANICSKLPTTLEKLCH